MRLKGFSLDSIEILNSGLYGSTVEVPFSFPAESIAESSAIPTLI